MEFTYQIIRSDRKTMAIEIKGGQVLVRCPRRLPEADVIKFVESKADWIEKHLTSVPQLPSFTVAQIRELADKALVEIPARVAHFAPLVGVEYRRITIRNQHSRWGSCSSDGNLNFNCLLMLVPPQVLDYVVVHELCHCKQMNHSPAFWQEVEKIMPNYRQYRDWLKKNGGSLIARLP